MKKWLLALMAVAMIATSASADLVIYVTGNSPNIRRTSNFGASWDNLVNISGAGFMGIDVAIINGQTNIFAVAKDFSPKRVYAFTPTGSTINMTTYANDGVGNQRPIGYVNGYVFVNVSSIGGANVNDGRSSWDGSQFGDQPITTISLGQNWSANDMAFVTVNGTTYQYVNGTSGLSMRRRTVSGGTLTSPTGSFAPSGLGGSNIYDLAFSESGRLLLLTGDGFYVSNPGEAGGTTFNMTKVYNFGASENPATGDMGPNGRDFKLYLGTIYAVTPQYLYRYTYDDTTGTISYVAGSASLHGLNNTGVQIAVIPEPGVVWLIGFGIFAARKLRRHV